MDAATATLLQRLEQVTARLEAVEKQIASGASTNAPSAASGSGSGSDAESASVAEFSNLINTYIKPFVSVTEKIGNAELKSLVSLVDKAVESQRQFLQVASACKKPTDQNVLMKLVEPTSKLMADVNALRDKNRANAQFNHLSTLSEGISCLGWVCVEPTPVPFINEARGSSEFYSNKLLVEHKKSGNQDQLDWVHHWNTFMKELANYVKKFHTTGLVWNPKGGDASSYKAGSAPAASSSAPSAGGPPPPPAGGPKPVEKSSKPAADTNALFAALNKGTAITGGLKKVTDDMKTKNMTDRVSVVSADAAPSKKATSAPKAAAPVKKQPPKFELEGNKWVVEFQENTTLEINEPEVKHTVYMYKCEKTVLKINGKVNNINIDNCKRSGVVFQNAVASCDTVNSTSIDIQVLGKVPSMAVDKCSGVQIYLSKDSLDVEIVTSKSDSMNVLIPDPAGSPDPVELPVPEQFLTSVVDGKLKTGPIVHV